MLSVQLIITKAFIDKISCVEFLVVTVEGLTLVSRLDRGKRYNSGGYRIRTDDPLIKSQCLNGYLSMLTEVLATPFATP